MTAERTSANVALDPPTRAVVPGGALSCAAGRRSSATVSRARGEPDLASSRTLIRAALRSGLNCAGVTCPTPSTRDSPSANVVTAASSSGPPSLTSSTVVGLSTPIGKPRSSDVSAFADSVSCGRPELKS